MMAGRNHSSGNFREHARNLLRPICSPSFRPWSRPVTLRRKIIRRSTTVSKCMGSILWLLEERICFATLKRDNWWQERPRGHCK
jgi:hypothetical protein